MRREIKYNKSGRKYNVSDYEYRELRRKGEDISLIKTINKKKKTNRDNLGFGFDLKF